MNAVATRILPLPGWRRRPWRLVERNVLAYRRIWYVFLSGFAEPLFFLLSIGIGVGHLVGDIRIGGHIVDYRTFVAPGLLATTAMNGALLDTTFNFFAKYKYAHTYDGVIATPLGTRDIAFGEVTWALLRGATYSTGFLVTMAAFGDIASWWAILALPAAVLIGFAFAGAGLGATTFMRSFIDFDYVNMAMIPLFLFSATFFPITQLPAFIQPVAWLTPLFHGVALTRSLALNQPLELWAFAVHLAVLLGMVAIGTAFAFRTFRKRLVV
jgi:lipooligosaccharide transport system permease protein